MKNIFRVLGRFGMCLAMMAIVNSAMAQDKPDQPIPPEVAAQNPNDTIPVGTRITTANWKQYAEFMPFGQQLVMSGTQGVPNAISPTEGMLIGPSIDYPLPKKYQEDTEKYAGQAQLVPVPGLGYAVSIATVHPGKPFPNPTEPNLGPKIGYNAYYMYKPAIMSSAPAYSPACDRYGNASSGMLIPSVINKSDLISDPGYPVQRFNTKFFKEEYFEFVAPEESKYEAILLLDPKDSSEPFEIYSYVPSLRRSLRLSANARCAPSGGGDSTNDDTDGGAYVEYTKFRIDYLGHHKILVMSHINEDLVNTESSVDQLFAHWDMQHAEWQRSDIMGKWELKDMDIIGLKRIGPDADAYCYGYRVMYLDRVWVEPWTLDLFDRQMKYWRCYQTRRGPIKAPWGEMQYGDLDFHHYVLWDFQNHHNSGGTNTDLRIDSDCPKVFQDFQRYATPAGLDEIYK